MRVTTLKSEPFSSNVHVVEAGEDALVVDAGTGADADAVERALVKVLGDASRVKAVFLTHWHCDHVGGAARLRRLCACPVHAHAAEASAIARGDEVATLATWGGLRVEPTTVAPVADGDAIEIGGRRFEVLHVPGHSPGSSALWEPATRSLFAGDLVFPMGSFGRVDFPGGHAAALLASLERVAALGARNLYAGHMEPVEGDAGEAIAWSLESAREMLG